MVSKEQRQVRFFSFAYLRTRMTLWMAVFLVPTLTILWVGMYRILKEYRKQMEATYAQSMQKDAAEIDAVLLTAKRTLASETGTLGHLVFGQERSLLGLSNMQTAGGHLLEMLTPLEEVDAIFVYQEGNLAFVGNRGTSFAESVAVKNALLEVFATKEPPTFQYQALTVREKGYLYLAYKEGTGYLGCWFSAERLLRRVAGEQKEGKRDAFFTDEEGEVLPSHVTSEPLAKTGYVKTTQFLENAPFSLNVLWERDVVYQSLRQARILVTGVTGLSLLLLVLYFFSIRRSLFIPLRYLTENIDRLKTQESPCLVRTKDECQEFSYVYELLLDMVSQIRSLRIDVYEKELLAQKTQKELYQLQIRPHFFLNALGNLRCLIQDGKDTNADHMAGLLMTHFRYVLYSSDFVLVDEELSFVENYLSLQGIQHNRTYLYQVSCPEELRDLEIPVLIIQILVENSLKHAPQGRDDLKLWIQIQREGRGLLSITVEDNGVGLSQEMEQALSAGNIPGRMDGHGIGLHNIRQRLALFYGDAASLTIQNRLEGGTKVEILLPMEEDEGASEEDEGALEEDEGALEEVDA